MTTSSSRRRPLRSETLSILHEAVHRGELTEQVALDRLERIWQMRIRYLGDAVLRRNAWKVAQRMRWSDTYTAEYIALTQLQGDAFVTRDAKLARSVKDLVTTATIDALN